MLVGFMDALPWDEDMEFMCGERWVADEGGEVKWCGLVGFASGDFVRVQCVCYSPTRCGWFSKLDLC